MARPRDVAATPSGVDVVDRLLAVAHNLRRFGNARLAAYRMSVPRVRLLAEVRRRPGMRMGDLTSRLGVTGRTLTVMVDALEEAGMLFRRADRTDRRATLLELTGDGRHYVRRAMRVRARTCEQAVAALSPAERRLLVDLLGRIATDAPEGGAPDGPQ